MTVNITRLGPGVLTFGETGSLSTWSSQVTKCSVVPEVKTDDPVPVLSGESAPGDRTEAFSIKGTILQDLGATRETVRQHSTEGVARTSGVHDIERWLDPPRGMVNFWAYDTWLGDNDRA